MLSRLSAVTQLKWVTSFCYLLPPLQRKYAPNSGETMTESQVMPTGMAVWSGEVYGQPDTCKIFEFLPVPMNGNVQFYLQTTSISKHKCFEAPEAKYRLQLQAEWGGRLHIFFRTNMLHLPKEVEFILLC